MSDTTTTPQSTAPAAAPNIPMTPVTSNQVAAIGYDSLTKTLAVTFTRGAGAIYHYPNVEPKVHADFIAAESIGKFFGQHIKPLPFVKYDPPATTEATTPKSAATLKPNSAWPFPTRPAA